MGKTPHRTVRVPDEVWVPAVALAAERGESVSQVVRDALVAYITQPPHESPAATGDDE